jgi:hypothetical protein
MIERLSAEQFLIELAGMLRRFRHGNRVAESQGFRIDRALKRLRRRGLTMRQGLRLLRLKRSSATNRAR